MNALTFRANRRERWRKFFAAIDRTSVAAWLCVAAILLVCAAVGSMEYADAVRLEGMR